MRVTTGQFLLFCAPLTALCQTAAPPPVRVLPAATVRSTERITSIVDVRHFSDGRVLVNVPDQRRMIAFDSALKLVTVVSDTNGRAPLKYPRNFPPLIPFFGDSVLFVDVDSRSFLVMDPLGKSARAMAPVKAVDLLTIAVRRAGSGTNIDAKGRLVYRANNPSRGRIDGQPVQPLAAPPDTTPVVRADFSSRELDTLAYIKIQPFGFNIPMPGPGGPRTATYFVNPVLPATDDWVVTSEGHVAFVRGSDYHIDWIYSDGSRFSSPKMPFDWRRLSDRDKQARIDSAKHLIDSLRANGPDPYQIITNSGVRVDTIHPTIEYPALDRIPDYFPPFRPGSSIADGDGNIWILPSTSSQSGGGLLYDVVNNKGVVFQRVRAPTNRLIVGFGRGGIVYMAALMSPGEWVLERTRFSPAS